MFLQEPLFSVHEMAVMERLDNNNLLAVQIQNRVYSVYLKPKEPIIPIPKFLKRKEHKLSSHSHPVIEKKKVIFWRTIGGYCMMPSFHLKVREPQMVNKNAEEKYRP